MPEDPEKTVYALHGQELASRGRRLGALAIDAAIIGLIVLMLFVGAVVGEDREMPPESAGLLTVAFLVFYHILAWTAFSATPGKMMLKLQIVDRNGWRIGIVQSIGRLFGYGVSTLFVGLGFAWIFVSRFGRGWHDLIAGTYVVYLGPEKSRSRDMAGDLYKDLMGGPPTKRNFAGPAPARTAPGDSGTDDQDQGARHVRVVDVDDARQRDTDRPAVGDYPVADFSRRATAFGLDVFASLVTSLAALFVLSIWIPRTPEDFVGEDTARQDAIRLSIVLALVFGYLVYPVISNWMFKSTVGKRIMNLQVVDLDGRNVGLSRLLIRHVCYLISAPVFLMGFISVLFDDSSQGWHDKLAGTYVTYTGDGRVSDRREARRPRTTGKGRRRSDWPTE
ncbi:MAG: RDD family protein [Chloroflexota bacterium]|nr:RDD family protein [Chloroflexota bacterium]MDE2921019.1 RDD family protein [Chloroflexota bacterium]